MKTQNIVIPSLLIILTMLLSACSGISAMLPRQSMNATPIVSNTENQQNEYTSPQNDTSQGSNNSTSTILEQTSNAPLLESSVIAAYEGVLENIYRQVNPSVVNIRVVQQQAKSSFNLNDLQENPFSNIPGFPDIPGFPSNPENSEPSTPQYSQSLGSGFVWDTDGHIITNNHVVDGAEKIEVTFHDDTTVSAKIVGSDKFSDLAVLKVDLPAEQLHPVAMADSKAVKVGEIAIAIGNPYGLEGTMTTGIISGLGRSLSVESATQSGANYSIPDIIQTDAPINPGNSGGVLVDDKGMVIGVTSAIESNDGSNSGIGFVIPSALVQKIVPSLISTGAYQHSYLGISGVTLTSDLAAAMDLESSQRGALVQEVVPGDPADNAGLKGSARKVTIDGQGFSVGGDVIVGIDNQPIKNMEEIIAYLANNTEVGQKLALTVVRDGKEKSIDVTLAARPSEQTQFSHETSKIGVWLGITGVPLSSDIAKALNLQEDQSGLLIQEIEANSPADNAGLQGGYKPVTINGERIVLGGDVILAIDGQEVNSTEEITQNLSKHKAGDQILVSIMRGEVKKDIPVTLENRP